MPRRPAECVRAHRAAGGVMVGLRVGPKAIRDDHLMNRTSRHVAPALVAAALLAGSSPLAAQVVGIERRVSRDGVPLDFAADGVWRRRAAAVAATRARLRSQAQFDLLNQSVSGAAAGGGTLSGTLFLPTVLLAFDDTDTTRLPQSSSYDSVFYTVDPLPGRPYTVRTLYEEMSNGQLTIGVRLDPCSSFLLHQ